MAEDPKSVEDNGARPQEPDEGAVVGETVPDDAFISPDEPIVRKERPAVPDDAFISPDEPIVRRPSAGVVVGMDGRVHHMEELHDVHLQPEQVANILEHTAQVIREEGVAAGLQVWPDAPHFEAMLKSYLAGYFSTLG